MVHTKVKDRDEMHEKAVNKDYAGKNGAAPGGRLKQR